MNFPRPRVACAVLVLLVGALLPGQAQDSSQTPVVQVDATALTLPGVEEIQRTIADLQANAELTEAVRTNAVVTWESVLRRMESTAQQAAAAAQWKEETRKVSALVEAAKAELATPAKEPDSAVARDTTITGLEQFLKLVEEELKVGQKNLKDLQDLPNNRAAVASDNAKKRAEAGARLEQIEADLKAQAPASEKHTAVQKADRALLIARQQFRRAEMAAYDAQFAYFEADRPRLAPQTELATRRVTQVQQRLEGVRAELARKREEESNRAAANARRAAQTVARSEVNPELLQELARTNAVLAELRSRDSTGLVARMKVVSDTLQHREQMFTSIDTGFNETSNRVHSVEASGHRITQALGLVLRRQRSGLPPVPSLESSLKSNRLEWEKVLYEDDEFQQGFAEDAFDFENQISHLVRRVDSSATEAQLEAFRESARELLLARSKIVSDIQADYDKYIDDLAALDAETVALIDLVERIRSYVDVRVLWIKSGQRLSFHEMGQEMALLQKLFSPDTLVDVSALLVEDLFSEWFVYLPAVILFVTLLASQSVVRRRLKAHAEAASSRSNVRMLPTVLAFLDTLLLALPWPLLMLFLGWRLLTVPDLEHLAAPVAYGLNFAGAFYFSWGVIRHICRRNGLGEAHFDWRESKLRTTYVAISIAMVFVVPMVFLTVALEAMASGHSLEPRLSFILMRLCVLWLVFRLLHPSKGLCSDLFDSKSLLGQMAPTICFLTAMGLEIAYIVMSLLGYHFSALELAHRTQYSVVAVAGIVIAQAAAFRWFMLARRAVAVAQAKKKIAAMVEQGGQAPVSDAAPEVDITNVKEQTNRLLHSATAIAMAFALWAVWIDVLPALSALDNVTLWELGDSSNAQSAPNPMSSIGVDLDGDTADESEPVPSPVSGDNRVSLADLGLAILMVVLALLAAQNIPGLLEITILPRLNLRQGSSYAITTLIRYSISVIGIVIAFSMIGITWSSVQWLAAAITVGIGFGLQEIFANFVSGLILLFERPIRVGDLVTVGDISGKISRIQMRATTIVDFDNRELLVPNKEFIAGRLINWTLTDPITRIVYKVGVAYGSDTRAATDLLLKIASDHPSVLREPAPSVVFSSFGDSFLDLQLRVFVPNLESIVPVRHELHTIIHEEFNKAGIEIAFPQRDVNIRSMPEITVQSTLVRNPDRGESSDDKR